MLRIVTECEEMLLRMIIILTEKMITIITNTKLASSNTRLASSNFSLYKAS